MARTRGIGPVPTTQASPERFQSWLLDVTNQLKLVTASQDPTTSNVATNGWVVWKNTTLNEVRVWVNDNGTMKKSAAFV